MCNESPLFVVKTKISVYTHAGGLHTWMLVFLHTMTELPVLSEGYCCSHTLSFTYIRFWFGVALEGSTWNCGKSLSLASYCETDPRDSDLFVTSTRCRIQLNTAVSTGSRSVFNVKTLWCPPFEMIKAIMTELLTIRQTTVRLFPRIGLLWLGNVNQTVQGLSHECYHGGLAALNTAWKPRKFKSNFEDHWH